MLATETLEELIRAIRPAPRDMKSVWLRFGDCRVRVNVNRPELVEQLQDYYREFREAAPAGGGNAAPAIVIQVVDGPAPEIATHLEDKSPEPGKAKVKEAFADIRGGRIVRKRLTGMVYFFSEKEHYAVGPCLENINQVVNFINNRYLQWLLDQGGLLGHAAGVILSGKGLAIAGFSGMGKSTLSLHVMSRGATFLSNDRVVVRKESNELILHGIAKLPRVNPGTLLTNPDLQCVLSDDERTAFGKLASDELWRLEHKFDVVIERCFGSGKFKLHAPMKALVILNWKRDGGTFISRRVNLRDRPDLLPAFMKDTGLFYLHPEGSNDEVPTGERYQAMLRTCEVYEFTGGVDFGKAADACENLMNDPLE